MPRADPPTNATALAALPAVALDLEATGLNPARDRIVQVAAIAMLGPRVLTAPRLLSNVRPGIAVPPSASAIHGLRDEHLVDAPPFAALAPALADLLEGRVVIGQHVAFDLALLRHEAARAGIAWRDPPALDVGLLFAALEPSLAELGLEGIADRLGVTIEARHTAAGDAMAAAHIFARLLGRLRELDVRTLGEARALTARRATGRATADLPSGAPARPPRIDSYVFERRVEELMSAPPVFVAPLAPLHEAARLMSERRIGALLVGEPEAPPLGILTERDVLRAAARADQELLRAKVHDFMSAPVQGVARGELLYRALARMDQAGFRHLCVLADDGRALGMLSQRDLLRHRARGASMLGVALDEAQDGAGLAAAYGGVPRIAEALLAEGVTAVDVARVISDALRNATARAAHIALGRLGPAPARWCLFVLGSAGRAESLLAADQDHALVHDGTPADDAWFAGLGEAIASLLDEAGIPKCKGGVMAANPQWRGNLADWHARIEGWLRRARPQDLLDVDIFFDLLPVAGETALAQTLYADALAAAASAPAFLALMTHSVSEMSPSLGAFGGLRTRNGRVDLKRGALLPLVGVARVLALGLGSDERSTPGRLHAALAAGRMAPGDAARLVELHASLLDLVLRQQLADLDEGVRPSARVATGPLGRRRRLMLARDLRALRDMLGGLRGAVTG
jgi:DNA polymerase-3 subunit epsilon/CBS domain-containing protein